VRVVVALLSALSLGRGALSAQSAGDPAAVAGAVTTPANMSEAEQLYRRGQQALKLGTTAGLDQAEKLFNDAVIADPYFAKANAGLAEVGYERSQSANEGKGERMLLATVAARAKRAIDLNPDLPDGHAALGNAYFGAWRFENARAELETAIKLDPKYAPAHHGLARVQESDGWLEDALASYRRAYELEPSPQVAGHYARALVLAGRFAEALPWADKAMARPDVQARAWKAWALAELNRMPEALEEAKRLAAGEGLDKVFAAAVYYRAGLRKEGDEAFRQIPVATKTSVYYLLAVAGRRDDVVALMAPAIGQPTELPLLLYLPAFDPIRGHPRFREILRMAGATSAARRAQEERAHWREEAGKEKAKGAAK
jgi:Tfp pilus assembly protein PilF